MPWVDLGRWVCRGHVCCCKARTLQRSTLVTYSSAQLTQGLCVWNKKMQKYCQKALLSCICQSMHLSQTHFHCKDGVGLPPAHVFSSHLPWSRGDGDAARLCRASRMYLQPFPMGHKHFWELEGFQRQHGHREVDSVLSVRPVGEATDARTETTHLNRRTLLETVNLLRFPAVHAKPGWRQEATTYWGLQHQEVGSLYLNLASQAPPGCRLASSGLVSFLGKQIKSLWLLDHSKCPAQYHLHGQRTYPYFSHLTSSLPWLGKGGSYRPFKYCCRILQ